MEAQSIDGAPPEPKISEAEVKLGPNGMPNINQSENVKCTTEKADNPEVGFIWAARYVKEGQNSDELLATILNHLRPLLRRREFIGNTRRHTASRLSKQARRLQTTAGSRIHKDSQRADSKHARPVREGDHHHHH